MGPTLNHAALNALKAELAAFNGCALKHTATQVVFAAGVPGAPVCVIGEAPGAEEDKVGQPFVGRSGQLLDKLLAEVGLSRQQNVYITNAVNWRPPNNRPPTGAEIAACRPFLRRHLAIVQPAVLLLVGRTAAKAVLDEDSPMTAMRQRWLSYFGEAGQTIPTLVTFHPAYLLRNPPAKAEALADFKFLQGWLRAQGHLPFQA
jgi:uracil-DNA glycosylase family 4